MVKFDIPDIRKDLPMSMAMAAFAGIAWYIAVELNIRLFCLFKRRKGIYFWSCALCSWGILLHPLAIILADFQVIQDTRVSIPFVYISWWLITVPFSSVMYSRLYLVMANSKHLRWVLYLIISTTLFISIPSMVMGPISQQPETANEKVVAIYSVWVKIENATWAVQESIISVLYITWTHKHLRDTPLFSPKTLPTSQLSARHHRRGQLSRSSDSYVTSYTQVLRHLIATNILIIALDVALIGIVYAGLFYLGGSLRPVIYGIKLRIEFSILNKLVVMAKASRLSVSRSTFTGPPQSRAWVSGSISRKGDTAVRKKDFARDASEVEENSIKQTTEIVVEDSLSRY